MPRKVLLRAHESTRAANLQSIFAWDATSAKESFSLDSNRVTNHSKGLTRIKIRLGPLFSPSLTVAFSIGFSDSDVTVFLAGQRGQGVAELQSSFFMHTHSLEDDAGSSGVELPGHLQRLHWLDNHQELLSASQLCASSRAELLSLRSHDHHVPPPLSE